MERLAIVYFPGINLEAINKFRQKHDPNWAIIKPHITLVFPISGISEEQLVNHLEPLTKEVKPFPISLNGLIKSFDNYLFLQVKEGYQEIIELHDKLYTEMPVLCLRDDIQFIPHITLGYFGAEDNEFNKELYNKAYTEAVKMKININCIFNNLTLIKGDEAFPAKVVKSFNLT